MLAATVRVVQVLDLYQIRAVITVFSPGMDPEQFELVPLTVKLEDELQESDALSITRALLALWSEMTK